MASERVLPFEVALRACLSRRAAWRQSPTSTRETEESPRGPTGTSSPPASRPASALPSFCSAYIVSITTGELHGVDRKFSVSQGPARQGGAPGRGRVQPFLVKVERAEAALARRDGRGSC